MLGNHGEARAVVGCMVLAFNVALVPFMPRPMISPLRTKTQPTGVSSDFRASSAYEASSVTL